MSKVCFTPCLMGIVAALAMLLSCSKVSTSIANPEDGRITFLANPDVFNVVVSTKATPVETLSSFYVTASTGSAGFETASWNNEEFTYDTTLTSA